MNNNVVEYSVDNKNSWMPESMDELITKALETVECKPIIKYGTGENQEYDNKVVYLDDNGETLTGYLAYQDVIFHERGVDGNIEVYKDIFITSEGEHKVFYTTIERTYDSYSKTNRSRINRIFPAFQTLSLNETEELIWDLSLK
ncbi:hypothetical protein QGM71_12355 [Virgibacillus sp. C22-A2]|uniref:Uncharacterized protein n=1 Tax=Virgibacillus tibetensis TaxID=3042313 RepID=A0ABU6KHF3_9BACI|nr:hypothetical protein [Virgibacillus sp. C22-A2]